MNRIQRDFQLREIPVFLTVLAMMSASSDCSADNTRVKMITSEGEIQIELFDDKVPLTVENFLRHLDAAHYDGLIFHRVISGFMIQTGGYADDLSEVNEGERVRNEADSGLSNTRGTLAMARMNEIDSARRQFFINVDDNEHLDHRDDSCTREDERKRSEAAARGLYKPQTCKSFGYTVFGSVVEGMDVVETIELADTQSRAGHDDVPINPIFIESLQRVVAVKSAVEADR